MQRPRQQSWRIDEATFSDEHLRHFRLIGFRILERTAEDPDERQQGRLLEGRFERSLVEKDFIGQAIERASERREDPGGMRLAE